MLHNELLILLKILKLSNDNHFYDSIFFVQHCYQKCLSIDELKLQYHI